MNKLNTGINAESKNQVTGPEPSILENTVP